LDMEGEIYPVSETVSSRGARNRLKKAAWPGVEGYCGAAVLLIGGENGV
jgi:hypothetical protein